MKEKITELNLNKPETVAENEPKINRGDIIRALAFAGLMGVVEACGGLRPEDIEKIPLTSIEQIRENPEQYSRIILKTEGYPESEGDKTIKILVNKTSGGSAGILMVPPLMIPIPGNTTNKMEWIPLDNHVFYKIHSSVELQSPFIEAMTLEKEYISTFLHAEQVDTPEKTILGRGQKTEMIGVLKRVKDGDKEVYVLDISQAFAQKSKR